MRAEPLELRDVEAGELAELIGVLERCMGRWPPAPVKIDYARRTVDLDRNVAVFDGGRMVGTASSRRRELALPGGATVPAAALTRISVLPTHRRRGAGSRLVERQLDIARQHGEPAAVLIASEAGIYARYGFGAAAFKVSLEIETTRAALLPRPAPDPDAGAVFFADLDGAREICAPLFERARRRWPGQLDRPAWWWTDWVDEAATAHEQVVLAQSGAGAIEGFCSYVVDPAWDHGLPRHVLRVRELLGAAPWAWRALWAHVLSVDLIQSVVAPHRPLDEPLRWLLRDPRRLRVASMEDMLWVRLLDLPAILEARAYPATGCVVMQVHDEADPAVRGRWRLAVEDDGARCTRSAEAPDLALGASELAAVCLGGVSVRALTEAGCVAELAPGAAARADRLFPSQLSPWCSTWF